MDTPSTRSKLTLPLVAIAAFVLGGATVLAGVAVQRHSLRPAPERAQVLADIAVMHEALEAFANNNARTYPDTLDLLVTPDTNGHRYLNKTRIPKDPWGRDYIYCGKKDPRVMTLGADGKPGGTGENADVDNHSILIGD